MKRRTFIAGVVSSVVASKVQTEEPSICYGLGLDKVSLPSAGAGTSRLRVCAGTVDVECGGVIIAAGEYRDFKAVDGVMTAC